MRPPIDSYRQDIICGVETGGAKHSIENRPYFPLIVFERHLQHDLPGLPELIVNWDVMPWRSYHAPEHDWNRTLDVPPPLVSGGVHSLDEPYLGMHATGTIGPGNTQFFKRPATAHKYVGNEHRMFYLVSCCLLLLVRKFRA